MKHKTKIKNIDLIKSIIFKIGFIESDLIKTFNLYGISFFEVNHKNKIKNKKTRNVFKEKISLSKEYDFYKKLNTYLNIRGNFLHGNFRKVIHSKNKEFSNLLTDDLKSIFNDEQLTKIISFLDEFISILDDISWDSEQNKEYKHMKSEVSPSNAIISRKDEIVFFNSFIFEIELRLLAQIKNVKLFHRNLENKKHEAISLSVVFNNLKLSLNKEESEIISEAINFRNLLVHSNFFELQEKLKVKYPELKETTGAFSFSLKKENSFKDLSKQERKDSHRNLNDTFGLSLNFYISDFGAKYNKTILNAIDLIREIDFKTNS